MKSVIVLFILSILALSSCKKENQIIAPLQTSNEMVLAGMNYPLDNAYLQGDFKILLTTKGMTLDSLNNLESIGCFDIISFSSWNKLVSGTYDWIDDGEGEAALNFCFPEYTNDYWMSFENGQGSFNVDISNDSINITGSGTLSDGNSLSFRFSGPMIRVE